MKPRVRFRRMLRARFRHMLRPSSTCSTTAILTLGDGLPCHCETILKGCPDSPATGESSDLCARLSGEAIAAFSDGLNTGFYINAYTTKHCPSMEGVLEEMRRGLVRLQHTRELTRQNLVEEGVPKRLRTAFGEALEVLKRLSASYRRCYWKSGSEMLAQALKSALSVLGSGSMAPSVRTRWAVRGAARRRRRYSAA